MIISACEYHKKEDNLTAFASMGKYTNYETIELDCDQDSRSNCCFTGNIWANLLNSNKIQTVENFTGQTTQLLQQINYKGKNVKRKVVGG